MSGWEFSELVRRKAARYLSGGKVHRDVVPGVYWVEGSELYRVQTDADTATMKATWISCTCPFGTQVGAGASTCSHAAAVLMALKKRSALPTLHPSVRPRLRP